MQAPLNVSLLYFHMFAHYSVIYAGVNFLTVPVSQPLSPVHGLTEGVSLSHSRVIMHSTYPRSAETIQAETDDGTDVTKDHLHANDAPEQI